MFYPRVLLSTSRLKAEKLVFFFIFITAAAVSTYFVSLNNYKDELKIVETFTKGSLLQSDDYLVATSTSTSNGKPEFHELGGNCNSSLTSKGLGQCLYRKNYLFLGDSILRNIFVSLIYYFEPTCSVPGFNSGNIRFLKKCSKYLSKKVLGDNIKYWRYSHSVEHFSIDLFYAHGTTHTKELLSTKAFGNNKYSGIVLSNAIWDMGLTYHGHSAYFYDLSYVLGRLSSYLANSSKSHIVVLGLHYIDTNHCATVCRVCNHKLVQEYVREVQQRVVSCTSNTVLVDAYRLTQKSLDSHDGVHPSQRVSSMMWQFILQALCSVGKSCSVFNKRIHCNNSFPKFKLGRILSAQNEVDKILKQGSSNDSVRNNFGCYQTGSDSLFWDLRFHEH